MKKRALSLILAAVMVCALLPTAALAVTVTEVIPCKYDYAGDFSEGLALVRLNGKYGYIDKTGREVIPCKYDNAGDFSEGLAMVRLNGKCGYIDKTGREVIPCKYDYALNFSEGLARVELDGKWGYVDKSGKEVVPCQYDNVFPFSEGLGLVNMGGQRIGDRACLGGMWGFVDATGREVIPCTLEYYYVENFSEFPAAVRIGDGDTGKCGYIDKTGREVIPCKYDYALNFSEGLAAVKLNGKYGYIDKTGREVIPCTLEYDIAWNFSEGLAPVNIGGWETGKLGYIDKTGKEVIPCKYDGVGSFSEGLAMVRLNGKCGYIAIDGYPDAPVLSIAYPSTQTVDVDGRAIEFQCYALKDENGNDTNYIKLRDLAILLNGTQARFEVGWNGDVTITTQKAYTPNGSELSTPFSGQRAYEKSGSATLVDGVAAELDAIVLTDDNGGGYTYYKLRDLGAALGIKVDWSAEKGIFIETK